MLKKYPIKPISIYIDTRKYAFFVSFIFISIFSNKNNISQKCVFFYFKTFGNFFENGHIKNVQFYIFERNI